MTSIGETLRRERIRQGLELQQLSHSTKIGTRMLQAVEQDDFSKLPGGVFTRSFIKQYAAALGLEPAALDEQLKSLPAGVEEPARSEARKDVIPERSHYSLSEYKSATNSGSILMSVVWVVVAMALGGGVYYLMNRLAAPATETVKTPVSTVINAPEKPEAQNPTSSAASAGTDIAPTQPAAPAIPVEIVLSATGESWVSVSADDELQFVGNMRRDEKRTVQAQSKVKLVTGNAGALEITLNGKPVDAIGPKGQVRVVEFTASGAYVVPRTSPKPAPLP